MPEGGEPDAGSAESIALIPDLLPPLELAASDRPVDNDLSFRFNPGASQAKGPYLGVGASLSNFDVYVEGGVRTFGYELGYREAPEVGEIGYAAVFFDRRSPDGIFLNGGNDGGNDAELPNDHDPWVHRFGGGVAASLLLDENTTAVAGVTYQRVSIREAAFTDDLEVRDEFGNRLTASSDGRDDLLTINLGLLQENLNDSEDPTSGTRWRVGVDQSIPIGESDILYNRVSGGYSRYFPLGTRQTLLVTVQGVG
ncbi:MAG: BamA/TamA family outer membrane protein, partial [Coleofasciculaceae cyanobacterium SM2_3_26]|nr:BamA/TamA family outer membrane protein [Coleofasciculaceae cyanobacterium SM2_3_26]